MGNLSRVLALSFRALWSSAWMTMLGQLADDLVALFAVRVCGRLRAPVARSVADVFYLLWGEGWPRERGGRPRGRQVDQEYGLRPRCAALGVGE